MIKIIAVFMAFTLCTLSLIITTFLTKDKLQTINLGIPNGKEYFRFKILDTDIIIKSWFFISSYVETKDNYSIRKYIAKIFISTIVSLFMLYTCILSYNLVNNIRYNTDLPVIKITNTSIITNIKNMKPKKIKQKTATHANIKPNVIDIFCQITLNLILFCFIYNALGIFLDEKLLNYTFVLLLISLIVIVTINDILSMHNL